MYKVIILPDAEKSFKKLDKVIQSRIAAKIDWLADNADTILHHLLSTRQKRMMNWSSFISY